ncbi:MAG: sulfite exporter TauE/SafE family protein [Microscillaceae bacterium]|jgi:hypothetical protein|nr:sulfite exporter TauE/SafE family protein [Microscillaceae bacterium]
MDIYYIIPEAHWWFQAFFLALVFVMAFLYAAVGHGGGSGYLAVLTLFGIPPVVMKPSSLILNIFVSFTSFAQFSRFGHFRWRLFLPLALASVPAAFWGAYIKLDASLYNKILAVCLLFSVFKLLGFLGKETEQNQAMPWLVGLLIGGIIGFLSGMLGIGGGILLSPILLLFGWANIKQTSAVSALFIFVNSISGLLGLLIKGATIPADIHYVLAVALVGGILGGYFGSTRFNFKVLRYLLAVVLLVAIYKLFVS